MSDNNKHERSRNDDITDPFDVDEEYAMEVAPGSSVVDYRSSERYDDTQDANVSVGLGWIALLFSIASIFFWPVLMGPTAAMLGLMSTWQGQRVLGIASIIIGVAAFLFFVL